MPKIVYIISGQICSGKTTFSRKLAEATGAIRFTPDEIMQKIFPFKINREDFDSYFYKCCDMTMKGAAEALRLGFDVILDFGFWKKADREKYKDIARNLRAEPRLFYIQCNLNTIKVRLRLRNNNLSEGCFNISEEDFDFYAPGFEEPTQEEMFQTYNNN